jgi:hypothetical protein
LALSDALSLLLVRYRRDPAAFKAGTSVPVLLWETHRSSGGESWEQTREHASGLPLAGDPQVIRVEKAHKAQNAFALGVTVGRVENNDIVVVDDSVSRFHAYFQWDERTHAWLITDAESKNGTWVGEVKLGAGHTALTDGALLRFGDTRMTFLLPASFFALLERK